jgi:putative transposase
MPRKPRLHVPGGLYHVIMRGNDRQALYSDDADRGRWIRLLVEGIERYRCRVHAYCWMTNHVHMAVQVSDVPLNRLIHWLAMTYSRQTNLRLGRTGHLFERRYRATLVDADSYLIQLVRYIHLNPVTANLVVDPRRYPWSSHRAYLGDDPPAWLTLGWVLSRFGSNFAEARRAYAAFMANDAQGTEALLVGHERDARVIGGDDFLDKVSDSASTAGVGRTLSELIGEYCKRYGVTEAELASPARTRRNCEIRARIAAAAQSRRIATLHDVAVRFGRSDNAISRSVTRLRQTASLVPE